MSLSQSVTVWVDQLKAGDALAAQRLWEVYFQRMVDLARRKLAGASRAAADEEDVALSAFKSFCLGAREGRFTQLLDRNNLWPLLMAITLNKSIDCIRGANRQKRAKAGHGESDAPAERALLESLSEILSKEIAEQLDRLLTRLDATGDTDLRKVALLKMQGYSTKEVADQLGCVRRTVERKLVLIARLWEKVHKPPVDSDR
jgi:DNA-directed RNA polymerase specialized sigma24 family protein